MRGCMLVAELHLEEHGGVAQLGEHLLCKQGVRSSILLISTTAEARCKRQEARKVIAESVKHCKKGIR